MLGGVGAYKRNKSDSLDSSDWDDYGAINS